MDFMNSTGPNPLRIACGSRQLIELIGDKWTMLVLWALHAGPRRNGELMRLIEGISQKMLTRTLQRLVADGIVVRRDMKTVPPHVEYRLTELGESLNVLRSTLDQWFGDHLAQYRAAKD